jgi:hypothetical protein
LNTNKKARQNYGGLNFSDFTKCSETDPHRHVMPVVVMMMGPKLHGKLKVYQ